ncbi:MAG: ATP-binding cassette domain-containing protein [Cyclobacteriaceae bacterium]
MDQEQKKKKLDRAGLKKLLGIFSYVLPYKLTFGIGMVFLIASSSIFMVFPYASGKLIDIASGKTWTWGNFEINDIQTAGIILLAVLFVQSIVSFFRVVLFAYVTEKTMANIRGDLYRQIITLPLSFFDKTRSGELVSRLSNDVTILQDTLSVSLAEIIRQFIVLIVGIVLIFFTAPTLSVFMLGTFPIIVILAIVFGRSIRKLSKKTQDQLASANVIVDETIQGVNSVKAFTSELYEIARYKGALSGVVKTALRVSKYRAAFISFIIFMLFGGIVAVMWYGALLVQSQEMTVGELLSFVLYTTFIGASIAGIGDLFGQVQKAVGASERILEIQEEEPEQEFNQDEIHQELTGNITFKDVRFSYPTRPETEVLKGINMSISAGEKVAIVGHSGAGKSTILQLLMRFYHASAGNLSFDQFSAQDLNLSDLRSQIAIVPQEVILFGGTISENIRYGRPNATNEEIKDAALQANALDFIEGFPEGFQTLVGERGVKLSGGQRQRIAIARAVLKDPKILILDEATSSLDAESEQQVQLALTELMKGRTSIVVAHRLSTIKSVDKIYVLDAGQIIEAGTHSELLKNEHGPYKKFIDLQNLTSV